MTGVQTCALPIFSRGRLAADAVFWKLVGGFTLFDVSFIVIQLAFLNLNYFMMNTHFDIAPVVALVFIFKGVADAAFFLTFSVYIFGRFIVASRLGTAVPGHTQHI